MAGNFFDKFAAEIREFDYDATDILVNGDTIASVQVLPLAGGLTIVSYSFSGATITFRIGGGTPGTIGFAVADVTLASGQFRQGPLCVFIKPLPGA